MECKCKGMSWRQFINKVTKNRTVVARLRSKIVKLEIENEKLKNTIKYLKNKHNNKK